ncbi:MAG: ribosomal protein S18-alanine N-acetyltransferase [Solirubrobacterales bacterium]|nr:ribosomal protein S18-alanine N-acetyltransferase [Solirubrobacterales bacterium]MCB0859519.1 ribosomal protein S18-alanine N-acetyltransferase [Solirubrobacterales bacterium]HRV59256.1 ribosomal protein S18-alanine N-acetyltransferase [Solirubrobacterales bacterium]
MNETATAPTRTETDRQGPVGGIRVGALAYADLPLVISIERRSFRSPWSVGMFALEMSKQDTIGLTAVEDDRVIGYLILSRFDRAWHLMNVAVAPEARRRGIASLLIEEAIGMIEPRDPVTLEVRPTNQSAVRLYEGLGFRAFGLRPGYYPDNGEDALIMWRGDPEAAGVPRESFGEIPAGT